MNTTPTPLVATFTNAAGDWQTWIHHTLKEAAIKDSHDLKSNLDNLIQPIFDINHWTGIDAELYRKMRPALQLASLWLTDDRMLDWFYHDTVGSFKWTTVNGLRWPYLAPNANLEGRSNDRKTLRQLWLAKLNSLSHIVRFTMYNGEQELIPGLMGCTFPFTDDLDRCRNNADVLCGERLYQDKSGKWQCHDSRWPYSGEETTRPGILISDVFRKPLNDTLPVEYLNCCFTLAVTLCHEIAHAAHSWPRFRYVNDECRYYGEVYSSEEELNREVLSEEIGPPEPGFSWERSLFGGFKAPEPSFMTASAWKGAQSPFHILQDVSDPRSVTLCSSRDIAKWFRKEKWCASRWADSLLCRGAVHIRLRFP